MKRRYRPPVGKCVVAAVRLPEDLYTMAQLRLAGDDLNFSQFVRRALRRELVASGYATQEQIAAMAR